MSFIKHFLLSFPFSKKELKTFRMNILQEMSGSSHFSETPSHNFSIYIDKMNDVVRHIDTIIDDPLKVNDHYYWINLPSTDPASQTHIWWKTQSPWMNQAPYNQEYMKLFGKYTSLFSSSQLSSQFLSARRAKSRLQRLQQRGQPVTTLSVQRKSGVTKTTSRLLNKSVVDNMVKSKPWYTPQQTVLFKTIISTYFSNDPRLWPINLNMDYVYKCVAGATPSGIKGWGTKLLKAALAGSGPFILKILQQISTGEDDVEKMTTTTLGKKKNGENLSRLDDISMETLTADIFTNIPPLTREESQYIKRHLNLPAAYKNNMDPRVLGSASIAEAHLSSSDGYLTGGENIPILLKFLKPMYAYYFLCEINFLLTVAWEAIRDYAKSYISSEVKKKAIDPSEEDLRTRILTGQCRRLMMFFIKEFTKEFDYKTEFNNTVVGFNVYNQPAGRLKSIVAVAVEVNPFPVLVLEAVRGKPIDSYIRDITKVKAFVKSLNMERGAQGDPLVELDNVLDILREILFTMKTNREQKALSMISQQPAYIQTIWVDLMDSVVSSASIDYCDASNSPGSQVMSNVEKSRKLMLPTSRELESMYSVVEELNMKWFGETLWGSGWFHADLHPGNVMWDPEKEYIYLIDYGSVGRLDKKQQCELITSMVDVNMIDTSASNTFTHPTYFKNLKYAEKFVKQIWNVCKVKEGVRKGLKELATRILKKQYRKKPEFGPMFLDVVKYSFDIGSCTHNDVLMFGRGAAYISNMIGDLEIACGDSTICPTWTTYNAAIYNLIRNPKQLVTYRIKGRVC